MYDRTNGSDSTRSSAPITGFVLGAVLGAGLALLLAPATGADTRRRLGDAARRVRDDARRKMDRGREAFDGIRQDASAAVDAGRDAVRRRHDANRLEQQTIDSSSPAEFR